MKRRIIYFRLIILAVFLLCSQPDIFSQGTDISIGAHRGMYMGLGLGPSQTNILNEGSSSLTNITNTKQNSFFGGVEIGYFFSNFIGLSSGFGYNSYKSQLTLDSYQSSFDAVDTDNEPYERRVSATGIQELQDIGFLTVPLCLNLRVPFGGKVAFLIQAGANMTVPLSKNYDSNGTFTYKGYYETYNVLIENLPQFEFPTNLSSNAGGELEVKSLGFNMLASAGFDFSIGEKLQIGISGVYDKSLSSIADYTSTGDFQLSKDVNQINSMMEGSSSVTTQSMGVKIVFKYFFR